MTRLIYASLMVDVTRCLRLHYKHWLNLGGGGKGTNARPAFFLLRIVFWLLT
jgi:hypothetical protein